MMWNPEVFRDEQYRMYQRYLDELDRANAEDESLRKIDCIICGNAYDQEDVFLLHTYKDMGCDKECYCCHECLRLEQEENDFTREEALSSLINLIEDNRRFLKLLPASWESFLMDETGEVAENPEASRFLREHAPPGYFLSDIVVNPVDFGEKRIYEFSYKRIEAQAAHS